MAFSTENKPVGSYSSTGIDVLIVGTGLAGLTAAIECIRKGHNVRVLERNAGINTVGMFDRKKCQNFDYLACPQESYSSFLRRHVFYGSKCNKIFQTLASNGKRLRCNFAA